MRKSIVMPRRIPPLNALRAFETAARHRSLSKAASELAVSQAAVSRHVKFLEEYLGVRLFDRRPSSLQLTATGKAYSQRLTRAFNEIASATDQTVDAAGKQRLSLRAYSTFMLRWLLPRLPDFQLKHPRIELNITTAIEAPDFSRDGIDVAIRYGKGAWPGLYAQKLFSDALRPFCTPGYVQRMGGITLDKLRDCTLLHHSRRTEDWRDWLDAARSPPLELDTGMFFDDLLLVHEAALRGLGIGITQEKYIEAELANGTLVCPFDTVLCREVGYYAVCRAGAKDQPGIEEFLGWLAGVSGQAPPP
ncbi:transcriptional regulator GcvA [Bordetella sp. H567]|uniref:transcriptional regulator GcvA n=1 Tax=Bordetella sp. H567 TaxID=1697043 RepID=UPI001313F57C|nr:transcriptional regulator GcvA [Bordetella sp. H567]